MSRSRLVGANKLRRTLGRIDKTVTAQVRDAVQDVAEAVKWDAVERAPVDEGDLVRSIDYKLSSDGMSAVVGPGARAAEIVRKKAGSAFKSRMDIKISAKTKEGLFQFFKGYWIEFGTKGNRKTGVGKKAPRPFMKPAWDTQSEWAKTRVRVAVNRALKQASQ